MIPVEWEEAVSRIRAHLGSMEEPRRLCLLAVACEHLVPFVDHAESQGLGVDGRLLRRPIDTVWEHALGRPASTVPPLDQLQAQVPTDWAGVGRSGHGAEQVAGLVRCLAIARELEADPTPARALDGIVGVVDALSDFGDLPEDELAELDRIGAWLAAADWPPRDVGSLRRRARRHGQTLLQRAVAMDLWADDEVDRGR